MKVLYKVAEGNYNETEYVISVCGSNYYIDFLKECIRNKYPPVLFSLVTIKYISLFYLITLIELNTNLFRLRNLFS